jgi:acetoacetyl-CoA synthetase
MPLLWEPSKERVEKSNMMRFIDYVNKKYSLNFDHYHPLYEWSITKRGDFWSAMWEFGEIISSKTWDEVLRDSPSMIGAKWFVGARLNFAENLLRFRDDRQAIIFKGEGLPTVRMTFAQLYDETALLESHYVTQV